MLANTRANLMGELTQKGGFDSPLDTGLVTRLIAQRQNAAFQIRNAGYEFKDVNMEETELGIKQFIPRDGYMPVTLISRGIRALDSAYGENVKNITPMQLKKRPRYTIDTKLGQRVDEIFRDIVQPRLGLLDSEQGALQSLQRMARVQRGPLEQLPMSDAYSDKVFSLMDDYYKKYEVNKGYVPVDPVIDNQDDYRNKDAIYNPRRYDNETSRLEPSIRQRDILDMMYRVSGYDVNSGGDMSFLDDFTEGASESGGGFLSFLMKDGASDDSMAPPINDPVIQRAQAYQQQQTQNAINQAGELPNKRQRTGMGFGKRLMYGMGMAALGGITMTNPAMAKAMQAQYGGQAGSLPPNIIANVPPTQQQIETANQMFRGQGGNSMMLEDRRGLEDLSFNTALNKTEVKDDASIRDLNDTINQFASQNGDPLQAQQAATEVEEVKADGGPGGDGAAGGTDADINKAANNDIIQNSAVEQSKNPVESFAKGGDNDPVKQQNDDGKSAAAEESKSQGSGGSKRIISEEEAQLRIEIKKLQTKKNKAKGDKKQTFADQIDILKGQLTSRTAARKEAAGK